MTIILVMRKTGVAALVLLGLKAGRLASWQMKCW